MSDSSDDLPPRRVAEAAPGRAHSAPFTPADRAALATITREVVARLAQMRAVENARVEPLPAAEIDRFCRVLVDPDPRPADAFFDRLQGDGVNVNTLYLGYVARAAVRLGERWDDDTTSIFDMTVATGRMYSMMRRLRRAQPPATLHGTRRAIFGIVPGERHTLGVTMAADLFRRRGWDIDLALDESHDELVTAIGDSTHSLIGLSASRPDTVAALARLIVDLRGRKPHAFILVSGKVTDLAPGLESLIDADIVVHDAPSAIVELEKIHDLWQAAR